MNFTCAGMKTWVSTSLCFQYLAFTKLFIIKNDYDLQASGRTGEYFEGVILI